MTFLDFWQWHAETYIIILFLATFNNPIIKSVKRVGKDIIKFLDIIPISVYNIIEVITYDL